MRRTPQFASIAFGSRGAPSRTVWNICALAWRETPRRQRRTDPASKRPAGHRARPPAPTRQRSSRRTPAEVLVLGLPKISRKLRRQRRGQVRRQRIPTPTGARAAQLRLDRQPDGLAGRLFSLLVAELRSLASSKPGAPSALVLGCRTMRTDISVRTSGTWRPRAQAMSRSSWRPMDARSSASAGGSRPTAGARPRWRTRRTRCKGSAAHGSPSPSLTRRARSVQPRSNWWGSRRCARSSLPRATGRLSGINPTPDECQVSRPAARPRGQGKRHAWRDSSRTRRRPVRRR